MLTAIRWISRISQTSTAGDDNYVIDLSEFGGGTITVLDVTTLGGDFIFTA